MNKAPAFQFYPKDWLSSTRVTCMTPEQRGAYIQLLCHAWNSEKQGTLPNDDTILANLSGLNGRWEKVGMPVKKMFKTSGRLLYNQRLVEERNSQIVRSEKCSIAGKASANKRLGVPTSVQHKSNSSSSSASSSSTASTTAKKKEKDSKHKHGEFKKVLLTDKELSQLIEKHGQDLTHSAITILDEYLETSGKSYKNHYLMLDRKWPMDKAIESQPKMSLEEKYGGEE